MSLLVNARTLAVVAGAITSIGLSACQPDAATSPAMRTLKPAVRLSMYDASNKRLGLTINAGPRFTRDTYRTITSNVIGGNGTYYYQWFVQPCFGTYCDGQYLSNYGWGVSSISLHLTADMSWVKVSLQAWDSDNVPFSGSDAVTLIGPKPQDNGIGIFKCELGFDMYPIHDWYPDHPEVFSEYRWDVCNGARVWDPNHPEMAWETL